MAGHCFRGFLVEPNQFLSMRIARQGGARKGVADRFVDRSGWKVVLGEPVPGGAGFPEAILGATAEASDRASRHWA